MRREILPCRSSTKALRLVRSRPIVLSKAVISITPLRRSGTSPWLGDAGGLINKLSTWTEIDKNLAINNADFVNRQRHIGWCAFDRTIYRREHCAMQRTFDETARSQISRSEHGVRVGATRGHSPHFTFGDANCDATFPYLSFGMQKGPLVG